MIYTAYFWPFSPLFVHFVALSPSISVYLDVLAVCFSDSSFIVLYFFSLWVRFPFPHTRLSISPLSPLALSLYPPLYLCLSHFLSFPASTHLFAMHVVCYSLCSHKCFYFCNWHSEFRLRSRCAFYRFICVFPYVSCSFWIFPFVIRCCCSFVFAMTRMNSSRAL